ncbi:MAG: TIGR02444 family protein [Deltaproteobacteria bacterium]|nr:TIGR02444 family protein [Deltaproteobacteria bacterium]
MAEAGWRHLWRFSLALYARPGVEAACLWLQERWGADVNLLLLCCWLERLGRRADAALLRRAQRQVAGWRAEAVLPLRRVRRRLRRIAGPARAWVEPVRRAAQAAELRAEQVEQRLLAGCAAGRRPSRPAAGGADGLERYRRLLRAPAGGAGARHLDTLRSAAGIPPAPGGGRD